jgi:tetratricopeptide (TPR) repeat protein
MALIDVFAGLQTWSDYISSREQIKGFEKALAKTGSAMMRVEVSRRDLALESGLGALGADIAYGMGQLANTIEFGFDRLADGIDKLNADFNLLMGDVIWKLETQNKTLISMLEMLQAPLDTAAKELRRRAEYAYQNGWYVKALDDFLESERKNYQDFAVHRSIANIYLYHLIDLPKALEYFRNTAMYAKPRDARQSAEAHYFAGIVCGTQQQFKEALDHMREATELNREFYEAWYMHAGFAALLGDAFTATASLETAIKGDARYHERAKTDPIFDRVHQQIQLFLDSMMQAIQEEALKAKHLVKNLGASSANLLPSGQQRISYFIGDVERQLSEARTYNDYLKFITTVPQHVEHVETEFHAEEQRRITKERWDRERAARERTAQEEARRREEEMLEKARRREEEMLKARRLAADECEVCGRKLGFLESFFNVCCKAHR